MVVGLEAVVDGAEEGGAMVGGACSMGSVDMMR